MVTIHTIACLKDNFAYIVEKGNTCLCIDVPEAEPIIRFLLQRGKKLQGILITHGHWDHIEGLEDIYAAYNCPIYAPQHPNYLIPQTTHPIQSADPISIGGITIEPLFTPGHMPAHWNFFIREAEALFTGDLLFRLGCGRILDGTPQDFFNSLMRYTALAPQTRFYPGHEYTRANSYFCEKLYQHDPSLSEKLKTYLEKHSRREGEGFEAVTLRDEFEVNPFLLSLDNKLWISGKREDPGVSLFRTLRILKDSFSNKPRQSL